MLLIALVLAVIGLAALVFAVVTSNEFIAYICIAASVLGVILLIVDALRERQRRAAGADEPVSPGSTEPQPETPTDAPADSHHGGSGQDTSEDYPEEAAGDAAATSSPTAETAGAEPGGSDEYDHGTAGQTAAGKDNTDNAS
jgi:type II secretory pathway pseudopilin PulG